MTVRKSETIDLDLTIDQAIQFIVSCGVVVPPHQIYGKPADRDAVATDGEAVEGHAADRRRADPAQTLDRAALQEKVALFPTGPGVYTFLDAQARVLEDVLLRLQMPYQVIGSTRFYERKEIKDVLAYLRLILNPRDPVAFARTMTRPSRGVGEGTISKIYAAALKHDISLLEVVKDPKAFGVTRVPKKGAAALKSFAEMYDGILAGDLFPIERVIETVLDKSGYKRMLETDIDPRSADRLDNVNELLSDARTKEQENPELDLSAWLEQIALISDTDKLDLQGDAVKLMTLHSAKGLEFPAVFLTGMEDGVLPHARSIQGDGDIEEERRLCYVGITRAQQHLTLSLARHREAFGRSQRNAPSRFLTEIPPELTQVDDQAAVASGYGMQDFGQWFTGRAGVRPVSRTDDNDDPFDFSDAPEIEDGPADHLVSEPRPAPAISPTDPSQLQSGDRVKHAVFGIGKVLDLSNTGRVKVHFQGWGEKSLALEFARLEKL